MAAALLGGQVSAEDHVYKVGELDAGSSINDLSSDPIKIVVDAQKTLRRISVFDTSCLTLDYQGEFVLTTDYDVDSPDSGVLNITTTVGTVASAWEEAFSVEGGGSVTLGDSPGYFDYGSGPVQFFGQAKDGTVQLGNTEVTFVGGVNGLSELGMNEVGLVLGSRYLTLVGKVDAAPVPEPTTGTLSLLALAGLCIRRRK